MQPPLLHEIDSGQLMISVSSSSSSTSNALRSKSNLRLRCMLLKDASAFCLCWRFLMGEVEGDDNAAILIKDLNTEYILSWSPISHSIRRLWLQLPSLSMRQKRNKSPSEAAPYITEFCCCSSFLQACAIPMYAVNWPRHVSVKLIFLASTTIKLVLGLDLLYDFYQTVWSAYPLSSLGSPSYSTWRWKCVSCCSSMTARSSGCDEARC